MPSSQRQGAFSQVTQWNCMCTVAILLLDITWKQWKVPSTQIPCESMTSLGEKHSTIILICWGTWIKQMWKSWPRKDLGSLRSGPWACRKPCHESLPSSILKLARAFVFLPLLFRKLFYLTLKLLLIFAFMYLHAIWVNSWLSNMYLWLIYSSLYTQA